MDARDGRILRRLLFAVAAVAAFGAVDAAPSASAEAPEDKPDILFILVDDLAWADPAFAGHPWHETPHLDRLRQEGMEFTDAYAPAPICSASRASILTGKSPARLGFEFVTKDKPGRQEIKPLQPLQAPTFTMNLPLEEQTIPELLKEAGYTTAFFGKWHLNAHHGAYLGWSPTHGPRQHGFDVAEEDFGSHPYSWRKKKRPANAAPGVFPSDSMTNRAVQFLKSEHKQPFFLMVSHFYVHTPVETPCRWLLDEYEAEIPAGTPNREKRLRYAAFLATLDHHIGELLRALEETGRSDDTLLVFTSDNGGHPEFTANGPLRGSKWNLYEGGIRVPFLVRWPGVVPPGSTSRTPVCGYDLLTTFAEVAGRPADRGALDGRSLVEVFRDPACRLDRVLYWHFPYYHPERGFVKALAKIGTNDFAVSQTRPHAAIRRSGSKLLYFFEDERVELYDLPSDPGELVDRSGREPELAAQLRKMLTANLAEAQARLPVRTGKEER